MGNVEGFQALILYPKTNKKKDNFLRGEELGRRCRAGGIRGHFMKQSQQRKQIALPHHN
jgi:hypothetical protein